MCLFPENQSGNGILEFLNVKISRLPLGSHPLYSAKERCNLPDVCRVYVVPTQPVLLDCFQVTKIGLATYLYVHYSMILLLFYVNVIDAFTWQ